MPTLVNGVRRDATHADIDAAVDPLIAALRDSPFARWAEPDPIGRAQLLGSYTRALIEYAEELGAVRLAEADRQVVGVAVWVAHPLPPGTIDVHDLPRLAGRLLGRPAAARHVDRVCQVLKDRQPSARHDYLACLGVIGAAEHQGVGALLVQDHLRDLARAGCPAYTEACGPGGRAVCERLGFTPCGDPVTVQHSPPVWPMRWSPPTSRP